MNIVASGVYENHKYKVIELRQDTYRWRCGYVEIKKNSPFFEKDYAQIPIECHGDLTYSGYRFEDEDDDCYYIGFDTGHFYSNYFEHDTDFCIDECKSIIEQLLALENGGLN